ncbi:thymidylate synthase [Citrobacter phage Ci1]|nr:thymidylate synthase [Citrobacter phage Ci1]
MHQYLSLVRRVLSEGQWIENERTKTRCLTIVNADLTYDVDQNKVPLVTTRKTFYKGAIAELLGYLRGYDNAADFRAIGCNTWNANANENEAWLNNPYRKGEDDMGRVYGVQGRQWTNQQGETLDQLSKIYYNLSRKIDDRGEILTFWNPGEFHLGCLRPCMHTHQFSIINERLYLNSFQRSNDLLLGQVFNQVQCFVLLALMAQITGLKPGKAFHKIVNVHIYENQYEVLLKEGQLNRTPYESPKLWINPEIKTLEDVLTWVTVDDFKIENYEHHPAIKYPFSV